MNESAALSILAPFAADVSNARLQMDAAFWMFQNTCPICQTVLTNAIELQEHFEQHVAAAINISINDSSLNDNNEENSVDNKEEINSNVLEKKQATVDVT